MKRSLLAGLVFLITAVLGRAGEEDFSRSISPEDFAAAGLNRLSPAELKRLDELVLAHKNGVIAAARRSAEEARLAEQAAEAEARKAKAAAETKASKAEAEARTAIAEAKAAKDEAAESKKKNQGFFAKAKVMLVPGTQIEYAEIKTTILGSFEGWAGRTIFNLANGQRWQVANSDDRYFTPPKRNVEVEIRPAALGGFWMFFPALKTRVRVKLLGEK